MSKQLDMTPQPDLSQKTGTGPVRTRLPVWRPALPPCNHACPAGENIQAWLALAEAGRFEAAWQRLIEENPLPAVHGRVCYHPCETACNRAQVDDAVSIHAIERFLGDEAPVPPASPAPGTSTGSAIRWRSAKRARWRAACCASVFPLTVCLAMCWIGRWPASWRPG